ncbi:type II 3-dehydroquinate dehydratase [Rhodococcus koreensis]|uniref:3-dehydroquinate dehydratase n=1 Tax=Rhodococcus koreensis TaxID=99653 RepID=A0A1H4WUU6_9NOCA|nr:type II 3-dehydroquinate dehydratase [Rhodococcus koreensis]SEC96304.1 3-dehydroquinate dehydratase [Rhodococcus koreensis]
MHSPTFLVVNGPNLNMLGTRQPEHYGHHTLDDVRIMCERTAEPLNVELTFFQSNHEGAVIDRIHQARGSAHAIVINPGAWTHTSVALRDALVVPEIPIVEVHITNIHAREEFRHRSFVSPIASAVIAGAGISGYKFAIEHLAAVLAPAEGDAIRP